MGKVLIARIVPRKARGVGGEGGRVLVTVGLYLLII
jgi:hypothetical protein